MLDLTETPGRIDVTQPPGTDTGQPVDLEPSPTMEMEPTGEDQQPEISVSPLRISRGGIIQLEGWGFPPRSDVQLGFGRVNSEFDLIKETQADQQGKFETELQVPDFVNPDDRWVVVAAADQLRIKVFSEELEVRN